MRSVFVCGDADHSIQHILSLWQLAPDVLARLVVLERKGRRRRHHPQPRDLLQVADQFARDLVRERPPHLGRIGGYVERHHDDVGRRGVQRCVSGSDVFPAEQRSSN